MNIPVYPVNSWKPKTDPENCHNQPPVNRWLTSLTRHFIFSTVDTMQTRERSHPIIPYTFPVNLWQLVNHPAVTGIVWDSNGESIRVQQDLLEKQVLLPSTCILTCCNSFIGTTFSSFIRQLYAYGFKKTGHSGQFQTVIQCYIHPNFKRNRPDLLSLMSDSATKYQQAAPEKETLPEVNENRVAHDKRDNAEEAGEKRGKSAFPTRFSTNILFIMIIRKSGQWEDVFFFLLLLQGPIFIIAHLNPCLVRCTQYLQSSCASPGGARVLVLLICPAGPGYLGQTSILLYYQEIPLSCTSAQEIQICSRVPGSLSKVSTS